MAFILCVTYVGYLHEQWEDNICLQVNSYNEGYLSCTIPDWEQQVVFTYDKKVPFIRKRPTGVTADHFDTSSISNKTKELELNVKALPVRDLTQFVSGELGACIEEWEKIANISSRVLCWLCKGVSVFEFFLYPFEGNFKGE